MAKAILVVDMPQKCSECTFSEMASDFNEILCVPVQKACDKFCITKPEWCPLKEMPDKMQQRKFGKFTNDELYMLSRALIESSYSISMLDNYTNDEKRIHTKLLNESLDERRARDYNNVKMES